MITAPHPDTVVLAVCLAAVAVAAVCLWLLRKPNPAPPRWLDGPAVLR